MKKKSNQSWGEMGNFFKTSSQTHVILQFTKNELGKLDYFNVLKGTS